MWKVTVRGVVQRVCDTKREASDVARHWLYDPATRVGDVKIDKC